MNVVHSGRQKRPSKLLDALRVRTHGGGSGHLGFGAVTAPTTRRPTVVASLSIINRATIEATAQAGVDGIELIFGTKADLEAALSAGSGMAIPLGIVPGATSGWMPSPREIPGIDWIRLPLGAGAEVLSWEKPARFISVPDDLELRRAPAFNLLEVDAFVLDGPWAGSGELSIEDVLRLAALCEIFKKPAFLNVGPGLPANLISVAKQCGIAGLLYQVTSPSAVEALATYIKDLEAVSEES